MHSPPSAAPEGFAENGAAETSAENGAGAFSFPSGVTTAAREVARGENLADARFRRAPGPPIWNESERAANWSGSAGRRGCLGRSLRVGLQ